MQKQLPKNLHLFEASWEVCNKVGGIYTVLASKLRTAREHFPDHYLPVGPFLGASQESFFKEAALPEEFKALSANLDKQGISLHYGHWLIDDEPPVLLVGWEGLIGQSNSYKSHYWEKFRLDTLGSNFYDIDQPLLWSIAVGEFVAQYAELHPDQPVLLQAHEWLTAGSILVIADRQVASVKTVFTTHATVLGRAISSRNTFIYDKLDSFNPEQEARQLNVTTKHQLEKLGATLATVFTTVSRITAEEAAAFLGRQAQLVVENGIDASYFPSFDVLAQRRSLVREQLHDFISAYFFPFYRFELANTRYQFTMGRYEVHNKGYDLYLQSLGKLNEELRAKKSTDTVIAFFLVPGDALRLRPEVSLQISVYRQVRQILAQFVTIQQRDLFVHLWNRNKHDNELELLPKASRDQIQLLLSRLPANGQPALSPFDLRQGENDAIIQTAKQYGLNNAEEDRVKMLFFPIYFDGFDGVFNLPLYEIISGCDLGVFPSFYEPWGYTPMETLAIGVPAVTSNLAGFGRAMQEKTPGHGLPESVFTLDRSKADGPAEAAQLTAFLHTSIEESERQWLLRRMSAYLTVQDFDWQILYKNYLDAYAQALSPS